MGAPNEMVLAWQAGRVPALEFTDRSSYADNPIELEGPVEQLLVAGGDSRLQVEAQTGRNRYGVPPRPRPEAVHFSSSTASAVSDYGFLFCDMLRRDLLFAHRSSGMSLAELRGRTAQATGLEITALLGLAEEDADVALAPSGTDTELLAVTVARSGAAGRPMVNLLMAPEESGHGVRLAGGGHWFDEVAGTGVPIAKGAPVWSEGEIPVHAIAIRDASGRPRTAAEVDADFLRTGQSALASGCHVLAHMLLGSKTGLSAPSPEAVDRLVALGEGRVDVVVDACQMRTPFSELGSYARRGWMLQVSGSKFLTGPPFSGALVVPAAMRTRAPAVGKTLAKAPGIGHASDWTQAWGRQMPVADAPLPSFGALFRWLPALLEARLLGTLPEAFRRSAFRRFRSALAQRLDTSRYLRPIDVGDAGTTTDEEMLARLSIMSFQVLGRRRNGELTVLGASACRSLFEELNRDVTSTLDSLGPADAAVARQPAHIGQPVTLGTGPDSVTVLRMVLGARFFSIIGYAGPGAVEAALQSEIADAQRAIDKLELLAEHWWRFDGAAGDP